MIAACILTLALWLPPGWESITNWHGAPPPNNQCNRVMFLMPWGAGSCHFDQWFHLYDGDKLVRVWRCTKWQWLDLPREPIDYRWEKRKNGVVLDGGHFTVDYLNIKPNCFNGLLFRHKFESGNLDKWSKVQQ